MGNCFRRCVGDDDDLEYWHTPADRYPRPRYNYGSGGHEGGGNPGPRPGPVTFTVVGYTAFARDLLEFETTNQVPEALSQYVSASGAIQRIWFMKLLAAWKRTKPAPASAEAVAVLIIQTLQGCFDIQGLLRFYHLPWQTVLTALPVPVPVGKPGPRKPEAHVPVDTPAGTLKKRKPEAPGPAGKQKKKSEAHTPAGVKKKNPQAKAPGGKRDQEKSKPKASGTLLVTPQDAEEIQYEIHTLPVKWKKDKGDGDGLTVYVNVLKDPRETGLLPKEIQDAALLRHKARAAKNHKMAGALWKQIEAAEYKMFDAKNGKAWFLARKYRIRLRGVDAPEIEQPYGKEARDLLRGLVNDQKLLIRVYDTDKYERKVGDIYCNGMFIQEVLLKSGSVWHYKYFDKRETFAEWHRAAKEACIGLWADPNPEAPWVYRKKCKNEGSFRRGGA